MGDKAKKMMIKHLELRHNRLYVKRNEGRRLVSIEECVDSEINRTEEYIEKD